VRRRRCPQCYGHAISCAFGEHGANCPLLEAPRYIVGEPTTNFRDRLDADNLEAESVEVALLTLVRADMDDPATSVHPGVRAEPDRAPNARAFVGEAPPNRSHAFSEPFRQHGVMRHSQAPHHRLRFPPGLTFRDHRTTWPANRSVYGLFANFTDRCRSGTVRTSRARRRPGAPRTTPDSTPRPPRR
jgi:hypothetical protein